MTNLPKSWHLYEAGEAIIRPRRRKVFYKGRRRSDRMMARIVTVLALVLIGMILGRYLPGEPSREGFALAAVTSTQVYYHRCSDARAAGAAPLRKGEPGYRAFLDSDGDGVACEPWLEGR